MKRMLDLCSGLKGWSAAFAADRGWQIVSVDNNPDLEPDILLDLTDEKAVAKFKLNTEGGFDLIVASPPCIEFYRVLAPFYPDDYGNPPDMTLVNVCKEIIEWFSPTTWVLENTECGHRFIEPELGPFRQRIGPFYLWGNFPLLANVDVAPDHKAQNDVWSDNPLRSNIKAKIPLEVSEGLLKTLQGQQSLERWL